MIIVPFSNVSIKAKIVQTCPSIVSEKLWDKANEILDARSKKYNQINKNNFKC